MFVGRLIFSGREIINNNRAIALAKNYDGPLINCPHCPAFDMSTDYDHLDSIDSAPWVDPNDPRSKDMLGIYGIDIRGIYDAIWDLPLTDRYGDGTVVGKRRRIGREIRVSGLISVLSEEGADYGLSWLGQVLSGGPCHTGSCGMTLGFYNGCPKDASDDSLYRELHDVSISSGPLRIARSSGQGCGGFIVEVEFTLFAGDPCIYSLPKTASGISGCSEVVEKTKTNLAEYPSAEKVCGDSKRYPTGNLLPGRKVPSK